jgi:hypothetical protein
MTDRRTYIPPSAQPEAAPVKIQAENNRTELRNRGKGLSAMGPALFVIAILGCGEGDAPCEQVRRLDTPYQSQASCMAATEAAMAANSEANDPVVVAQCVAAGANAAAPRPAEVRLPPPGRAEPPRYTSRQAGAREG